MSTGTKRSLEPAETPETKRQNLDEKKGISAGDITEKQMLELLSKPFNDPTDNSFLADIVDFLKCKDCLVFHFFELCEECFDGHYHKNCGSHGYFTRSADSYLPCECRLCNDCHGKRKHILHTCLQRLQQQGYFPWQVDDQCIDFKNPFSHVELETISVKVKTKPHREFDDKIKIVVEAKTALHRKIKTTFEIVAARKEYWHCCSRYCSLNRTFPTTFTCTTCGKYDATAERFCAHAHKLIGFLFKIT